MNRTFERITNDSLIKQSSGGLVSYLKVCFSYLLDFLLGCSKIFKTILQKKEIMHLKCCGVIAFMAPQLHQKSV